jgi:hypothetical protein
MVHKLKRQIAGREGDSDCGRVRVPVASARRLASFVIAALHRWCYPGLTLLDACVERRSDSFLVRLVGFRPSLVLLLESV